MDLDFFQIAVKEKKGGGYEAAPDFVVGRCEDLMVRAKTFYAVWDEDNGLWSTDEYDVQRIVDAKLRTYAESNRDIVGVKYFRNFGSNVQTQWRKYLSQIGDNAHQLDETLTFQGTQVGKKDYVSKRLPYDLAPGDISAWSELVGTLYKPEERAKIEWAIGSIISGDSKKLQKFVVLYGPPGAGKGTIINICLKLFDGYVTTFDAKALGSSGNQFAAAAFAGNPLVAIQHDGDLSKIEDNTLLNSIVSHEIMKVNEKYKPSYDAKINAFLIMGTNKPVKITDAQSGLIRRLIDVHPTGTKLPPKQYHALMARIDFELGAIAHHCLQVYKEMGKNYYGAYQPLEMMFKTNAFFNFIEANYDLFEKQDGVSAKQAWNLYKEYCEEANIEKAAAMKQYAFKSELGNYFEQYHDRITIDGVPIRSYYSGFKGEPFKTPVDEDINTFTLRMDETTSLLDLEFAHYAAQYSSAAGAPRQRWDNVKTTLAEIDTTQEHYVHGFPESHIVLDFDLKDEDGNKSLERNLQAAAEYPPTYAELSKSGQGVHLHYNYLGDVSRLEREVLPGIETKVFTGNSSLRRRLSRCNDVPIATISSGLPIKEKKRVLDLGTMKSEKALRELIARNLRKEVHPGTKPSIDFIKHILDEAYESGMTFDVTDLRQKITFFANNSSNKALECLKIVQGMRFKSDDEMVEQTPVPVVADDRLVIYDLEVYSNLFVICWAYKPPKGEKIEPADVVRMINPKPHEVEALMSMKLVGFNNRNYDNHILWGAAMGFNNAQLKALSDKIINGVVGAKFGEAYKISYTDLYDLSTKKQGLKKWQIELGLDHREMDIPWDAPVPEDRLMDVVEYCANDVISTAQVLDHLDGDFKARLILADLSGLSPNDTTAKHTSTIVFGREKNPQREFVYTDLSKQFPGYTYGPKDGVKGNPMVSTYRGEVVGEGGYVYAEPGLYKDVVLLDVASMHPTSIGQLNLFGDFTPRFMDLVNAQLVIKRFYPDEVPDGFVPDFDAGRKVLDGKLTKYIDDIQLLDRTDRQAAKKAAKALRHGLKIAINIVYGLTSAKFDNPFRDVRNVDNIVAKRGALFMVDLKHFIQEELGLRVVHIKTDSVKVPGASQDDIERIQNFAAKYGYDMEHEATYAKFGLVNDAVYVAKKDECITNCWSATGTQYQHPYVFKKLFGYDDDISFLDTCETKHVQQGALHLDFGFDGEGYVNAAVETLKAAEKAVKKATDENRIDAEAQLLHAEDGYNQALARLIFVGKTGRFTPVKEGFGGGQLYRIKDGKHYAAAGTRGHLWVDSNIAMDLPGDAIDYTFYDNLVEEAVKNLEQFLDGSPFKTIEDFVS